MTNDITNPSRKETEKKINGPCKKSDSKNGKVHTGLTPDQPSTNVDETNGCDYSTPIDNEKTTRNAYDVNKNSSHPQHGDSQNKSNQSWTLSDLDQEKRETESNDPDEDKEDTKSSDGFEKLPIAEAEYLVRCSAESRKTVIFILEGFSSVVVFVSKLLTFDAIFAAVLSAVTTAFLYYKVVDQESWKGTMSFFILGFALTKPMSLSLNKEFIRRDSALRDYDTFRSYALQIYSLFATFRLYDKSLDKAEWLEYTDEVLCELLAMGDELGRFLTLPNASLPRHRVTRSGKREAARTLEAAYYLKNSFIVERYARLCILLQKGSESNLTVAMGKRFRILGRSLINSLEDLCMYKVYRTPLAMRAFEKLFSFIVPLLYAPSFVQVAINVGSLPFGVAFAVVVTLALKSLSECIESLEDPFICGIDMKKESTIHRDMLLHARERIFVGAPPLKY